LSAQLAAAEALPAAHLRAVFQSPAAQRWPRRRLGDALIPRNDIVHPRNNPKGRVRFVGLEHIQPHTGRRIGEDEVEMAKLTGRKAQFFAGDIVYGYLRPYLNKVWIADFDGLCSVDQYVYRVADELADTDFIGCFMRSETYLRRAPIGNTPGQLPRIRLEEVAAVEIELPPLAEQRAIAKLLNAELTAAAEVRTALAAKLADVEKLPAALLRAAFSGTECGG
jgi:type I restriction enzyme S subunit